jgi:thiamine biosynthesis lipoprotein
MIARRKILIVLVVSAGILLMQCGKRESTSELLELRGRTMGTTFMVKTLKKPEDLEFTTSELTLKLSKDIGEILTTVNRQMSTWVKDSEISRFNRYRETGWFDVSSDTALVFAEALRVSELSNGAFDITVGPLVNLWGFGPAETGRQIPGDEQIKEVMAKTGYQKLSVRPSSSPPAIKKEIPGIQCDLSAIAKGFGVDKLAEYLESKGYMNYLVEIGGEVRGKGINHEKRPWRVAILAPGPGGQSPYQKVLSLKDKAMATSGDYFNYFEKDGVRYSHTIDPTTGKPITHKLASVTVIHDSCMTADAVATAINVLGPAKGYELALKENLPVFLVIGKGNTFIEKMTPQFRRMIEN